MCTAIITFSKEGLFLANVLKKNHQNWSIYIHSNVFTCNGENSFDKISNLMETVFRNFRQIIFIGPCGIAVRSISPYITHKTTDPAVVVVDAGGRFVISLLSGHEGGANNLTFSVANILGAEPCISTTTEAVKTLTVGIGCRKGISSEIIIEAINAACEQVNIKTQEIRSISTVQIKSKEAGLIQACKELNIPLRIVPDWQILRCANEISKSKFVEETIGLPGVAEPAALVNGRNAVLLLKKFIYQGVTVAIAQERCLWSE